MKTYGFKINGRDYKVAIDSVQDGIAKVNVNGKDYEVIMNEDVPAERPVQETEAATVKVTKKASQGSKKVTSPLPGVILNVFVSKGDKVKAGQKIAVLEAMKMENDIEADCSGTVSEVFVFKGDSVLEGAPIITIE